MLKESRHLLFERQNDRKMRRVFAWFSTFCMSFPYFCPILAQTTRLRKDNSKIINSSFSHRVCVYERLLEVKISGIYSKLKGTYVFRVCSVCHLGCFYTVAKNFYTISRIRLCIHTSTHICYCITIILTCLCNIHAHDFYGCELVIFCLFMLKTCKTQSMF